MANNRRRVALVGKMGSGKTTLIQRLSKNEIHYEKTQMVTYTDQFIDTPGEFIDHPALKTTAINVSCDAGLLLVIVSALSEYNSIAPNFVMTYNIPALGVVTQIDRENADIRRGEKFLQYAGVRKNNVFTVSAITGEGIHQLQDAIHSRLARYGKTNRGKRKQS